MVRTPDQNGRRERNKQGLDIQNNIEEKSRKMEHNISDILLKTRGKTWQDAVNLTKDSQGWRLATFR